MNFLPSVPPGRILLLLIMITKANLFPVPPGRIIIMITKVNLFPVELGRIITII